jgi:Zn-dependent M16 (insulinase) family peptidase
MATLNTESLPTELRSYLILLLELLTESPIRRGDKLVPYEEIVKQLDAYTISSGTRLGLESRSRFSCDPFSKTVCVMLQVEPRKYETGITLLSELLFNTEFTVERIKVCAAKMVNGVAEAKRDGNSVVKDFHKSEIENSYKCV